MTPDDVVARARVPKELSHPMARVPIKDRILNRRAVAEAGCWLWTGSVNQQGYGRVSWKGRLLRVHRVAAHLWLGLDLDDTETKVCHHCDVPACFNPEHLYLGTQKTNVRDMIERGRRPRRGPARRTECKRGHPLTDDNVIDSGPKGRSCKQCKLILRKRRYQRDKMLRAQGGAA